MHVQHPAEVTRLPEPEGADGDVGTDLVPVVVRSLDLADISVTAGQEQFPPVFTDHQRGKTIPVEPHWPEGLGDRFKQPVRV